MERIFKPNRWFVLFCGLLILVWGALRLVGDVRLAEKAKMVAEDIFTWSWPDRQIRSQVNSLNAQVLRRGAHDAVVTVTGRQTIEKKLADASRGGKIEIDAKTSSCKAVLTFYRSENNWELGKVELK